MVHPLHGPRPIDRFLGRFSPASRDPYAPAPVFGQHTFGVYRDLLGFNDEQIAVAIGDGLFT